MYVAKVPNRSSPPAFLLRESYRQDGKVKSRTLANITNWPAKKIDMLRRVLKGETLVPVGQSPGPGGAGFEILRGLPRGHVAAVLGALRHLKMEPMLDSKKTPWRDLAVAMIVARVIDPQSKPATARGLGDETAFSSLWGKSSASLRLRRTICMRPWTGYWKGSPRSSRNWPSGICGCDYFWWIR